MFTLPFLFARNLTKANNGVAGNFYEKNMVEGFLTPPSEFLLLFPFKCLSLSILATTEVLGECPPFCMHAYPLHDKHHLDANIVAKTTATAACRQPAAFYQFPLCCCCFFASTAASGAG